MWAVYFKTLRLIGCLEGRRQGEGGEWLWLEGLLLKTTNLKSYHYPPATDEQGPFKSPNNVTQAQKKSSIKLYTRTDILEKSFSECSCGVMLGDVSAVFPESFTF